MKKSEFYNKVKQLIGSEPDRMLFSLNGKYLLAEGNELIEADPEEVIGWNHSILHFNLIGQVDDPPHVLQGKTVTAIRVSDFGLAEAIVKAILRGDEAEMITTVPGSERVLITAPQDNDIPRIVILKKIVKLEPVQAVDPYGYIDEMPEIPQEMTDEERGYLE